MRSCIKSYVLETIIEWKVFRGKSDKKFQNQHSGNDKHVIDNGSIERITVSQSVYVCLLWVNALMKTTHLLRSGYLLFISNNSTCMQFTFLYARTSSSFFTVMLKISNLCDYWFHLWITTISELIQWQILTEIVFHTNEHSVLVLIKALEVLVYYTNTFR